MLRGEPATSPSLHCIRGWDDYWWPDSALFTCAARSAALSTLTTLARTKPPPDRPCACLLRPQLRQLPRSDGSSCRFCMCGNGDWSSRLCAVRHGPLGLAASGIPPKGCRTKGCRTRRLPKQGCRSKYIFLIGFNMNICGTVGASFAPFPPSSRSTVAPPDTQTLSMHNNHRISQQPVALGLSAQQSAQQSAVSTAATTVNCYSSCQR